MPIKYERLDKEREFAVTLNGAQGEEARLLMSHVAPLQKILREYCVKYMKGQLGKMSIVIGMVLDMELMRYSSGKRGLPELAMMVCAGREYKAKKKG